jgi:hypothetical protein
VYLGTSTSLGVSDYKGNWGEDVTSYTTSTLAPYTTYYWRIDEVNNSGTTTGTVWSFTTGITRKYNPGETLDPSCLPTDSNCGIESGSSGGASATGVAGQMPYYALSGNTLTATSAITILANGMVGIHTVTPKAKFTITNNVASGFLDNYSEYQVMLYDSGTAADSYGFGIKGNTMLFNSGGGAYSFDAGGNATRMFISTTGNIGIGTTSPAATLSVNGSVNVGGNITPAQFVGNGASPTRVLIDAMGSVKNVGVSLNIDGTSRWSNSVYQQGGTGSNYDYTIWNQTLNSGALFIDGNTNNIGIGTTSPYAKLSVAGTVIAGILNATTSTSTFAGINLTSGCFAINNVCISGGSGLNITAGMSPVAGDLLYYDGTAWNRFAKGGDGQVLKMAGGALSWGTDLANFSAGGINNWATSTDGRLLYPYDTTQTVLVGFNATSGSSNIFEVKGNSLFYNGNVHATNNLIVDGNIGIGTSSPQRKLHVTNDGSLSQILLESTGSVADQHYWGFQASSTGAFVLNSLTDALVSTNRVTVTSGGSVGIGTSSPISTLAVQGTIYGTGWNFFGTSPTGVSGSGNMVMSNAPNLSTPTFQTARGGTSASNFLGLQGTTAVNPSFNAGFINFQPNSSVEAARFTAQNNFFLGATTSPTARLTVTATSSNSTIPLFALNTPTTGALATSTVFIVDANGKVGIGTSSPLSRLTVWGPDTLGATAAFTVVNSASTTEFQVFDDGSATLAGTLTQNSDQRLKTNIQSLDASSSLTAIMHLDPVSFTWIDTAQDQTPRMGFIAQEVQKIFPELVSTTSATTRTPDGTLGLNYIGLIAPMVESIKELARQVQSFAQSVTTVVVNATTGNFEHVNTKELCVGSTCVSETQLKIFLQQTEQNPTSQSTPASETAVASTTVSLDTSSTTTETEVTSVESASTTETTDPVPVPESHETPDTGTASSTPTSQ